jgi:hypothetical protein
MIVFDLQCGDNGHVFEAWFGSTDDYESQRARGLVECPICGSGAIEKAVMAPRLAAKGNSRSEIRLPDASPQSDAPVPMASGETSAAAMKAMLRALAEAQKKALEGSDYVGKRFAEEARAIHEGDSEERAIHGQATPEEARALIEDGVHVAPLPFPIRPPGRDN